MNGSGSDRTPAPDRWAELDALDDEQLSMRVDNELDEAMWSQEPPAAQERARPRAPRRPKSTGRHRFLHPALAAAALLIGAVGLGLIVGRQATAPVPTESSDVVWRSAPGDASTLTLRLEPADASLSDSDLSTTDPSNTSLPETVLAWPGLDGAQSYRLELLDSRGLALHVHELDGGQREYRITLDIESEASYARLTATLRDGSHLRAEIVELPYSELARP